MECNATPHPPTPSPPVASNAQGITSAPFPLFPNFITLYISKHFPALDLMFRYVKMAAGETMEITLTPGEDGNSDGKFTRVKIVY